MADPNLLAWAKGGRVPIELLRTAAELLRTYCRWGTDHSQEQRDEMMREAREALGQAIAILARTEP